MELLPINNQSADNSIENRSNIFGQNHLNIPKNDIYNDYNYLIKDFKDTISTVSNQQMKSLKDEILNFLENEVNFFFNFYINYYLASIKGLYGIKTFKKN